MALTPGSLLGVYEVAAQIGVGGMGEVYRATDTNLKRQVAIKVLAAAVAGDPDRLARFQREAEVLAALNHPNIAAIYGLERAPDFTALVMELVEGEDLSQRIERGPIPIDEALPMARQIADALEAAHELGIIHRDLKPANIKVRADGTVKVLDFGLAKALDANAASTTADNSPTITSPAMTTAGIILGTAAYMSPEQARGGAVDKRADTWAFGVVLYEMLTGSRMFVGETLSDVLAEVLKAEPRWDRLPADTPRPLRRLLRRCLERDPRRRIHDIADARIEIDEAIAQPDAAADRRPATASWRSRLGVAGALVVVGLVAFGGGRWMARPPASAEPEQDVVFAIQPSTAGPALVGWMAFSRDGARIVFLPSDGDSLLLRELGGADTRVIPGTAGGQRPFISPDGKWVGFFADGKLKKVAIDGGDPIPICDAALDGPGATWASDGFIYFTQTFTSGLVKVDANGGTPAPVTSPNRAKGEAGHMWADELPGGTSLVFTVFGGSGINGSSIARLDVRSGKYDVLFEGAAAQYVPTGHLVYYHRGTHYAVPFDPEAGRVAGPARAVLRYVQPPDPTGARLRFAFSNDGRLAFVPGPAPSNAQPSRLAWVSRDGRPSALPFEGVHMSQARLSPDGQKVTVARYAQGESQIWVLDLARGTQEPLTRLGVNHTPMWHPDSRHIGFTALVRGNYDLWWAGIDGSPPPEPLVEGDHDESGGRWTADGRSVIFQVYSEATGPDLMLGGLDAPRGERKSLVATPLDDSGAELSRDGKWLAYTSGDALYVSPFPTTSARTLIARGAYEARWSTRELFFIQGGQVMASGYTARNGSFEFEAPRRLFDAPQVAAHVVRYDVAADGRRFLFLLPLQQKPGSEEVHVRLNGFDELRSR